MKLSTPFKSLLALVLILLAFSFYEALFEGKYYNPFYNDTLVFLSNILFWLLLLWIIVDFIKKKKRKKKN